MSAFSKLRFVAQLCALAVTFVVFCTVPAAAQGQGIHITLLGNSNPFPNLIDRYSEVWGDGNYAYVASQRSYAGVLIFDISNPNAPTLVGNYAPASISTNMQGLSVSNGIGYFGDDNGSGLHIVDVSNPAQPRLITRITAANGGYNYVHDLFYDSNGHVYIPNYRVNDDVQVWNVSNPAAPYLVTTITGHDASSTHDVTVINNRLYMAGWAGTVDIFDVTNIDTQPATWLGSFLSDQHNQNMWPTADGNYLVVPHEINPYGLVRIYNISNPAAATLVSTLSGQALGISAVTPSESRVMGNLLYVSWYQAGTVVFDITNPAAPIMVGNYDTFPGAWNEYQFGGNWGVYPFLGQNKVLLSDQDTGLYVVDCSNVSSQPALFNFSVVPAKTTGGYSTAGTIYLLGQAQAGGFPVTVTSSDPAAANTTVVVPAGATSYKFSEATSAVAAVTTLTLTASDGTYSDAASLTLTPPIPSRLVFAPSSVVGGNSTIATVSLNVAPIVNTTVTLQLNTNASVIASIPSSVVVAAGTTSVSFPILTYNVTANAVVQVAAMANGGTKTANLTVTPDVPTSVAFNPTLVTGGTSTTGTVTLAAPVNADTAVTLAVPSGATAVASVPASVTVAAGTKSASFAVTTNTVSASTSVQISATLNGVPKTGSFTVH